MTNRLNSLLVAVGLTACGALCAPADAMLAPPETTVTYQGVLSQSGSLVDGLQDFRFGLFDVAAGGSALQQIELFNVTVVGGQFTVELDFGISQWSPNSQFWLEIEAGPADGLQNYELIGRQKLTATPFAINTRGIVVDGNSSVAIGSDLPAARFEVQTQNGGAFRVFDFGPDGDTQLVGAWIGADLGPQLRYTGARTGGFVDIGQDGGGSFVVEQNDVPVMAATPLGDVGIGTSTPQSRLDVRFSSGNGIEVTDSNTATAGIGVQSTVGVGTGVRGESTGTGSNSFGVYGQTASVSGWGVYSNGRLGASGTKSFMIDHPLDPMGAYLLHYSSESPEPQNRYNGNIVLDNSGQAIVLLPDYFESINRDFRYTLTPIGAPAPNLYIAREVENNRFVIAGGVPGQKITWEVIAQRHDRFVQQRGAPIEVQKVGPERGKLLIPELYGLTPEDGIHYVEPARMDQPSPKEN